MKNVLITGGGNGLGFALATLYQEQGYHVTILDVHQTKKLEHSLFIPFDLSSFNEKDLKKLEYSYDIVICNAGISLSGNFTQHSKEQNEKVWNINTLGHIELIKQLLQQNKIQKNGNLAFVTSSSVYLQWPVALSYAASKAGLDGFAHALESYLHGKGVSVTRVYPGPMKTDHVKYYDGISENKGSDPFAVAQQIVKAINKRKRKCFPDTLSKIVRFGSALFPKTMSKIMYKKYEKHLN